MVVMRYPLAHWQLYPYLSSCDPPTHPGCCHPKGTQIFRLLQPTLQPRLLVNNKIAKIHLPYPRQCTASIDYAIRTFCFFSYGLMRSEERRVGKEWRYG